ncbi:MAG: metal-dependent hydrolase [Candidatus Woesearchaeota archaeon]
MTSTIGHLFVGIIYFLFPKNFNLYALLISSIFPDIEYIFFFIKDLIKKKVFFEKKNLSRYYLKSDVGILHSLFGTIFISLPLCLFFFRFFFKNYDFFIIFYSIIIGLLSHLFIDIPGHRTFILFYPIILKKNPFIFKLRLGFFEKFYPWKKLEQRKNQVIFEYNWFVFSHIFLIISLIVLILIKYLLK